MIRVLAVNIDGVLLEDTFSPVIKDLIEELGGTYDRDLERNVFSQGQSQAANYIIDRLDLDISRDELIRLYFEKRKYYTDRYGNGFTPGAEGFLSQYKNSDYRLVCYGGLDEDYFLSQVGAWAEVFFLYVCTNDFRPGLKEILEEILAISPSEVLFVDDVNRVAEAAKALGTGFVGMPSPLPWGFQKQDMRITGVKYMIRSLNELTPGLIETVARDLDQGNLWSEKV